MVGKLFGIHFVENENEEGREKEEMETETKSEDLFLDLPMESKNTFLKFVSDFHKKKGS